VKVLCRHFVIESSHCDEEYRRGVTTAQRIVLSIGLGIALYAIIHTNVLGLGEGDDAWFNYAPNSGVLYTPDSVRSVMRGQRNWTTLQWLVGATVWTAASFCLFRAPAEKRSSDADEVETDPSSDEPI
jgi:hypothetical protein